MASTESSTMPSSILLSQTEDCALGGLVGYVTLKVEAFGTIICFIITHKGIFIGLDSKGTTKWKGLDEEKKKGKAAEKEKTAEKENTAGEENELKVWIIGSETVKKYQTIDCVEDGTKVIIAYAGNKTRIEAVLSRFKRKKKYTLDKVYKLVADFYSSNQLPQKYIEIYGCQFMVAGYDSKQAYMLHHLGDGMPNCITDSSSEIESSIHGNPISNFGAMGCGAMGCGARFGLDALKRLPLSYFMDVGETFNRIKECLLKASTMSHRCGGNFRYVSLMEEGHLVNEGTEHHINVLRKAKTLSEPNTLLFYSCEDMNDMNYHVLFQCLHGKFSKVPYCPGMVFKNWFMYVVEFESKYFCESFLRDNVERFGNQDTTYKECMCQAYLTDNNNNMHHFLICPAKFLGEIWDRGFKRECVMDTP